MKITIIFLAILLILSACTNIPKSGDSHSQDGIADYDSSNGRMLSNNDESSIVAEKVSYGDGFSGYFAYPTEGTHPGVVMIHEWWGLNDNIRQMARQLAAEGYAVLAVDLYDGNVAEDASSARSLVTNLNQKRATENLRAATTFLREKGSSKIASLGWCFGGGQSLQLAISGEKLDGTIIYYGNLVTNTSSLKRIKWPVLGIFGAEDMSIPVATVQEFDAALGEVGISKDINIYPGVAHAFTNPSGANYAPEETKDAWNKTIEFLSRNLG